MKTTRFIFQAILYILCLHCHAFAQPPNDEDILTGIEKKRSEAIAAKDADFLNNLYDESFYGVTALGLKVDKKTLLQIFSNFKSENKVGPENMTAKIFGESGITQGLPSHPK